MANRWGNNGNSDFIFLGSKITVNGKWSHEIKRSLLLGRKAMTNLDSILKSITLTIQTFVGKVTSLLFNILSRFVMAFLPRSKLLLISWLHLPFTVILEPKKIKAVTISIVSPSKSQTKLKPQCHMWSLIAYGTGIAKFVRCYLLWRPSFWISIKIMKHIYEAPHCQSLYQMWK